MTDRIRAGIVGGGFMATVHARAIRRSGAVLSAVVSSTPERSREAAAVLGAESAADSLDQLLDSDVDGVKVIGPANLVSDMAADASQLYAKNLENLLGLLVSEEGELKRKGFSDRRLAELTGQTEHDLRNLRRRVRGRDAVLLLDVRECIQARRHGGTKARRGREESAFPSCPRA